MNSHKMKLDFEELEMMSGGWSRTAGGVLTENDKRFLQVLIIRAKKDPEITDTTCFVNTDWGVDLTDEMTDYLVFQTGVSDCN